ncbi:MAG TPA: aminotransferase class III-fold pyridoxal phosphate-dependent enzyme [Thermoanaerobaculia bacterium]|nr:aminotransferase class III-fold pyridoxal phosphate-dependent enzyme [Thermoanaerobaculia bacterium]
MSTPAVSRARWSAADARRIARDIWNLDAAATELPGERDSNFALETPEGRFVLKLSPPGEAADGLELQNAALAWLERRAPELPLPRLRPAASGLATTSVSGPGGAGWRARLVTFLPGRTLAQARPRTPALLRDVGRLLGGVDAALAQFRHPAAVGRDLFWNPDRAQDVIARFEGAIADPRGRRLVSHFAALHRERVLPLAPRLSRSVIHNDGNDWNVLVGPPASEGPAVAGLLDFGDMLEAWTVCEPAVAIAYAWLCEPDPLAAAAAVVAGYHDAHPLGEDELAALFPLATSRLAVSVCLSAHRRTAEPDNGYLLVTDAAAWETLERLADVSPNFAECRLRAACGFAPSRNAPAVEAWLASHRRQIGPVVAADLSKAVVFDLSVGSPELESPAAAADTAGMTEKIFGKMRAAGAPAAIGRYDEARLVYQSAAFRGPEGEHPEMRTVHLAVDIFLPPGAPVFAPLPGRVVGRRDNAARLDYGPTIILEHAPEGAPIFHTLYGHLTRDSLEGLSPGQSVARGQTIGRVGEPPENGDWPPHVHFQIVADLLGKTGDFPGVAAASQRAVWLSISPDPSAILGVDVRRRESPPEEQRARRRKLLGPSLSLSYRRPLEIVRGAGQFLYDETGRAYLDVVNNVAHVGHGHPRVVAAGARQMAVLNTNTRYLHESILRYAERLTATLPAPLSVCFFVCSGSEANELALRLARAHTKARDLAVVDGAYHGNTAALVDASPYKFDGPGGEGAPPHVHKVPMPDDYRGLHRRSDPERGQKFARHVAAAAQAARDRGEGLGAFLCESLLSCGGQIVLPPGYLEAAYGHARAAGAVCIADEVQVGFGRVGSHFWGFQTQGVVPDIVTMGKPIGNGHPLAAVVTTPDIAASFANGMEYFNTFGGNPVSCEIGLAVLDVVEGERLQERSARVGRRLRAGLEDVARRHAIVGDVRGLGLFLGIELVRDRETLEPAAAEAAYVVERMKDHGILLSTDGPLHNVIKMKPPLVFSEADADRVVAAYDRVLGEDFVTRIGRA